MLKSLHLHALFSALLFTFTSCGGGKPSDASPAGVPTPNDIADTLIDGTGGGGFSPAGQPEPSTPLTDNNKSALDEVDFRGQFFIGQTELRWNAVELDNLIAYNIRRALTPITDARVGDLIYRGNDIHFIDAAPPLADDVHYRLFFEFRNGERLASDTFSLRTLTSLNDDPPLDVTNIDFFNNGDRLTISWQNPIDEDLRHIYIYRAIDQAPAANAEPYRKFDPLTFSFTDDNVQTNVRYVYRFLAEDSLNNQSAGVEAAFDFVDTLKPDSPNLFESVPDKNSIFLSWFASPSADIDHYALLRNQARFLPYNEASVENTITSTTLSVTDINLNANTAYKYALYAIDASGNASDAVNLETQTTDLSRPESPNNFNQDTTNDRSEFSVTLNWSIKTPTLADKFVLAWSHHGAINSIDSLVEGEYKTLAITDTTKQLFFSSNAPVYLSLFAVQSSSPQDTASLPATLVAHPIDLSPPPVALSLTAQANNQGIALSWQTEPTDEQYDVIIRWDENAAPENLSDGQLLLQQTASLNTAIHASAEAGKTYHYSIFTVDARGNVQSENIPTAHATALEEITIDELVNLQAVPADGEIRFSWNPLLKPTTRVYFQNSIDPNVELDSALMNVAFTEPNKQTYVHENLANGLQQNYWIYTEDIETNVRSQVITYALVPADNLPPLQVQNVTASAKKYSIQLNWEESNLTDARQVIISMSTQKAPQHASDGKQIYNHEPGRKTTFVQEDLLENTLYYFSFFTLDSSNNESAPVTLTVRTVDTDAPLKPLGLLATARDSQILLSWQRQQDDDVSTVRIIRNPIPDDSPDDDAVFEINASMRSFLDTTAVNNQPYNYLVKFIDQAGLQSEPASINASAVDTIAPPKIYNLTANGTDFTVDLQWKNPIVSDATKLIIQYQKGAIAKTTSEKDDQSHELLPPFPETRSIEGLENGQLYAFSVFALDNAGNVNGFESITAEPRSTAPAPPATEFTANGEDALVRLNWVNPPSNYTGIRIYRSSVSYEHALTDGELVSGAELPAGQSSYTDIGLPNGVTQFYVLINVGENDPSTVVQASAIPVDQTEPFPINDLQAYPSDRQIQFTWADPGDDDLSHILIRRGDLGFPLNVLDGVEVATVAKGVETALDENLANGDIYFYAFFAIDGNGYHSQRVTLAAAARDTIAPSPVTSTSIQHGNGQVQLSWTNPSDIDLSRIVIRRANDAYPASASSGFSVASLDNGGGSIPTSFTDSGLTNDETYFYSLFALDENNNASIAKNLQGLPVDIEAPPPISALSVNELDGQVAFEWDNPTGTDFARVVVRRKANAFPNTYDDGSATLVYEGIGEAVTDNSGIINGNQYYYRFFTLDAYDNAAALDIMAGPIDLTPPALPTCTSCIYGDRSISLTWQDPADPDLQEIQVRRSTVSPPASLDEGTPFVAIAPGVENFTDTGLTNGTTYFYALFSKDTNGNVSSAYAIAPLTPADEIPPAPVASVGVVSGEGFVTLNWTNPIDDDFEKVTIRRDTTDYPSNSSEGTLIAELSSAETTYTDLGVNDGEDYFYSVFSFDEPEANNASAPVNFFGQPRDITPPPAITGQAAVGLDKRIDLTWTNPTHPDFDRVRILRKEGSYPTDPADGSATSIYEGALEEISDISALTNFTTYYYRFFSLDAFDNYLSSDLTANPIDLTAPALVSCTSCSGSDASAILTWTNPADADLAVVRIRRSTAGYPVTKDTGDVVADLIAGETTYTDTGLINNENYYYAIFSEDTSGNVSAAYQVPLISPADDTLPAAVSGLTAINVNQQVVLSWTNPGDDTVKVYINRGDSSYPATLVDGTALGSVTLAGASDTFTDVSVTVNEDYFYSLFSEDEAGNVSTPATYSATPLDLTAPSNPTGFSADKNDYRLDLSWTNPSDPDFNSVKIYRRSGSTLPTATATYLIATLNSGETSYADTGLSAYTQYSYRITSGDTLGNFSSGSTSSAFTDYAPIDDVTLKLTIEKDSKNFLQWTPSSHSHYNSVHIRRSTGPAPATIADGDFVYSGTATSVLDSGLTNGTPYQYTIFSIEDDSDVTTGTQLTLTPLASGQVEYEGPINFDGNGAGQASALEHLYIGGTPTVRVLVGAQNNATASYSGLTMIDYNGNEYSSRNYPWGASAQKVNDISYNGYWFAAGSRYDASNTNDDFALWKITSSLSSTYSSMNFDTGSASFNDEASNITYYSNNYYSSGYRDIAGTVKPVVWRTDHYTQLQIGFSSGSWTIPTTAAEGKVVDHIHTSLGSYLFAIESSTGADSLVLATLSSTTGTLVTSFAVDGELIIADQEITSLSRAQSSETSVAFPIYASSVTAAGDAKIYAVQANGSLNTGFGSSGVVTLTSGLGDYRIEDMVVESDGTLHVIGSLDATNLDIMYWRIATDGSVEVSNRITDGSLGTAGLNEQWPDRILLGQYSQQVLFTGTGFDGSSAYEILFARIAND